MTRPRPCAPWPWRRCPPPTRGPVYVLHPAGVEAGGLELATPESAAPIDIARLLLYARNLAASRGLGRPAFGDPLTAASATIGNRYAGRLYVGAMRERTSRRAREHAPLTYEVLESTAGLRVEGRWLTVEPFWPPAAPSVELWIPAPDEAKRRARDLPYREFPRGERGERRAWTAYPPEEAEYKAFVQYVLRRASVLDRSDRTSRPFVAGLRDGVDVRVTLRHWKDGTLYVREEAGEAVQVTNGIIDYASHTERSHILRGKATGRDTAGWVDPDCEHVGNVSRESRPPGVLQNSPCQVTLRQRDFSLITLDCPTYLKADNSRTFYTRVIEPLLHLRPARDTLYGWLEVMFAFCRGKPVVYYSHYVPGPRVHAIARDYGVRVLHHPLPRIPAPLFERHRRFRFLWLTRRQWEALLEQVADAKHAWTAAG